MTRTGRTRNWAVALSKVDESLGATNGVLGQFRDPGEEERQPLAQLAALAHGLEAVVVPAAVLLEIGTEVQQQLGQQLLFDQQERDQQATQPPVAVEERVDRLDW